LTIVKRYPALPKEITMAIERGTGATTAYAAQRYAPRPTREQVGRTMSAKQLDFLTTLVKETQILRGARVRAMTPPKGITAAEIEGFAAELDAPRAIIAHLQAQLNRTGITGSALITEWINARDRARAAAPRAAAPVRVAAPSNVAQIIDGEAYRAPDGAVYRAYTTQRGILCLKLWDEDTKEFTYAGSARRAPAGLVQLSIEESREFGRATGTCIRCMRHLTDDESVRNGIGPICASRL
jgi:hypothetical protein